jgi:hypothetical protein
MRPRLWLRRRYGSVDELLEKADRARRLGVRGDPWYTDLVRRAEVNTRADDAHPGGDWLGPRRRGWLPSSRRPPAVDG